MSDLSETKINDLKIDFSSEPITIIPLKDGKLKFFPMNMILISEFLLWEEERKLKKDFKKDDYCGAI